MGNPTLQFRFSGPEAQADAEDLAEFLRQQSAEWSSRVVDGSASSACEPGERGLETAAFVVAVVSLLLAIPRAVKDSLDLADRIKLKRQLAPLPDWARRRRNQQKSVPDVVLPPGARPVPLDEASLDDIVDAIAAQVASQRRSQP